MKARKKRLDLKEKFCIPPQSNIMRNSQPLIDPHSSGICSLSDRILRNFQIRKWRKRSGIRFPLITTISSKNRHTQKKKKKEKSKTAPKGVPIENSRGLCPEEEDPDQQKQHIREERHQAISRSFEQVPNDACSNQQQNSDPRALP